VCVITLIRGNALWGRLWIDPASLHLAGGLPVGAAPGQHKGRGSRISGSAAWRWPGLW